MRLIAFSGLDGAVRDSKRMGSSDKAVLGEVAGTKFHQYASGRSMGRRNLRVVVRQHFQSTGCIPPVPHEVGGDSKLGHDMDPCCAHAVVGISGNLSIERPGRVCVRENGISFLEERQSQERGANLSDVGSEL